MNAFIDKLKRIERRIADENGEAELFALFRPDTSLKLWDLLVAARWADQDEFGAMRIVAKKLREEMSSDEMMKFSRIVIIKTDNPGMQEIHSKIQIKNGASEFKNVHFFGVPLLEAVIITSVLNEDLMLK